MSEIILVTGGNRSGKSSFAEKLLAGADDVLYIATAVSTDAEMEARIRHHRASRNKHWATHEGFRDLRGALELFDGRHVLLDCVTNMISNLIYYQPENPEAMDQAAKDRLLAAIQGEFAQLLDTVRQRDLTLVLVSNEVGMGLISEYELGRLFVDYAGFINQYLAREADRVHFMVAGLPLTLKGD